jgi:diacylglycerol kinase (ATP)
MPSVSVIVNPASRRGRGARLLPELRAAFAAVGVTDVRVSAAPGEEEALARRAVEEGRSTIVACGGDGTWSNVANAILAAGADTRLALVAAGTGNDFYKTVGAPARDIPATARLAVEGPDVRVDVGRVEGRHFLNVTGFGFNMAVLEDIRRIGWLQGPALYNYSALRQLLFYRGAEVEVASARGRRRDHLLLLVVTNGRHYGGTFRIATGACLTDGRLDLVAFRDAPPLRRVRLFAAAIKGTHPAEPEVAVEQGPRFSIRFDSPPAYEVDGEYHRAASAEVEVACVPAALRVVTPADNRC